MSKSPLLFIMLAALAGCPSRGGYDQSGAGKLPQLLPSASTSLSEAGPAAATLAPRVHTIGVAARYGCFVHEGAVRCWGSGWGLGTGDDRDEAYAPRLFEGLPLMTSIGVAAGTACAVTAGGTLWCWGYLVGGDSMPRRMSNLSDLVQVAVHRGHACALNTAGETWCWGHNIYGVLGSEPATVKQPVRLPFPEPLRQIGVCHERTCGLGRSGKLWCYGRRRGVVPETTAIPFHYPKLANLVAFDISKWVTCGVGAGGELRCKDILFRRSASPDPAPEEPRARLLRRVLNVSTVGYRSCAVTGDGAAYCFTPSSSPSSKPGKLPAVVGLEDVRDIAVAQAQRGGFEQRLCAVHSAGSVSCWGNNERGRLGLGRPPYRRLPPKTPIAGLGKVAQVVAGPAFTCARLTDGRIWCSHEGNVAKPQKDKLVVGLSGVKQLASSSSRVCAIDHASAVRCFSPTGTYLYNRSIDLTIETVAGLANVTAIAMSDERACAVLRTGKVRCFDPLQTQFVDPPIRGLSGVVQVAVGQKHTCARIRNGQVRCWGENRTGALGTLSRKAQKLPRRPVFGLVGAVKIAVNGDRSCAIDKRAQLRCWGHNRINPHAAPRYDPWRPRTWLKGVAGVAMGWANLCAIMKNGTFRCWGEVAGNPRQNTPLPSASVAPWVIAGLSDVAGMVTAERHACARFRNGGLSCWGSNSHNQLGDESVVGFYWTPQRIWDP